MKKKLELIFAPNPHCHALKFAWITFSFVIKCGIKNSHCVRNCIILYSVDHSRMTIINLDLIEFYF